MLKMKVKLNFKLLSSNASYDNVVRAEALNTCGLFALCVTASGYKPTFNPEPGVWHGTGKCRRPIGARRPTGEEWVLLRIEEVKLNRA
uniref:Uncharacterized protein n=1 Tax=Peronospora matthiolae TaxID=2874970 RepID=A0AAV1UYK2_9STRA